MKTVLLLAALMLSLPCFAQKSSLKVAMERIDACEGAFNYVMDDNIALSNENAELRIKIADLEKQLEQSQTLAKFWANFAAEGLKQPVPINSVPVPMPSFCTTQHVYDTEYTICN